VGKNSRFMVRSKAGSAHFQQCTRGAGSAVKGGRNRSFMRKPLRIAKQRWKIWADIVLLFIQTV